MFNHLPLHTAAENGHSACPKLLLAHEDININIQTDIFNKPLLSTVDYGRFEYAKLLLESKHIIFNIQENDGWSLLRVAVRSGRTGCVVELLSHTDIKVNIQSNVGKAPSELTWDAEIIPLFTPYILTHQPSSRT